MADETPLLQQGEERFRAFVTATSDVVYRMSPDWSEMRQLVGRDFIADTETPSGTWLETYIHPDDQAHVLAVIDAAIRSVGVFQLEHRVVTVDGTLGWTFSRAVPLVDSRGEIREWIGVASDVTKRKQAEEALRESETKYRLIVDTAYEGIVIASPDGPYTFVNRRMAQMLGYSVEEMLGRSSRDFIYDDQEPLVHEVHHEQEEGLSVRGELKYRRKDGTALWTAYSATAIHDEQGRHVATIGMHTDITESKRLEDALRQSEERFRISQENSPDMFSMLRPVYDEHGEIVDFVYVYDNPAGARFSGRTPAEMVGRRVGDLHPAFFGTRSFQEFRRVAVTGVAVELEESFELDGSCEWYRLVVTPTADGIAVSTQIITERRQAELALQRANERLQEEDRRKDDFLAMLGHELRNPLAAIRNSTEIIKRIRGGDPRLISASEVLDRQALHMSRLLHGLLEVSRIRRGKVHLEREVLDLREVLEGVLRDRADRVAERGLKMIRSVCAEPVWIDGDRVRLAQVVDNLIGNAIKFTPSSGTITAQLRVDDDTAVLSVKDTGTGIGPELLSRVFEPFLQEAQQASRPAGGLGLGLAIAEGLVVLHGGTIEARSEGTGTGAELVVRLPVASPVAAQPDEPPAPAPSRRVLLVEDNIDAAQSMQVLLEMVGHEVVVAGTGEQALEVLRSRAFDVVFCDLGLPGISGYDVAREIRRDEALREVVVVAMTGYGQPSDRARTLAAGFDVHLTKPVAFETLESVLSQPLSART